MTIPANVVKSALRKIMGEVNWTQLRLKYGKISKNTYYDKLTDLVMANVLSPTSVCIDVGCHKGKVLQSMMAFAPEGKFLAFEPLPDFSNKLKTDPAFQDVHVYNLALSNSKGTTTFNYVKSLPGYSGFKTRQYPQEHAVVSEIEVNTDLLDNILAQDSPGKVDLIKVDVEGAELLVFEGAKQCIKQDHPFIVFEHGLGGADYYGCKPEDVYQLLVNECGLKISLLGDFLRGKRAFSMEEFSEQFYKGKNYYFLAHP